MRSYHAFVPHLLLPRLPRLVTIHRRSVATLVTPPKHVILVSGGVESSTLLHLSSRQNTALTAVFFNYGQRAAAYELKACRAQCAACEVQDLVQLDLRSISDVLGSRSGQRRHIPLIHRNAVLLGITSSLAGQQGARRISIAICKDDSDWYPSASPSFIRAFQEVGTTLGIRIETPFLDKTKAEVIGMGLSLGVDYTKTWSCMIGRGSAHCGRCGQCKNRREAMRRMEVVEQEGFYQS